MKKKVLKWNFRVLNCETQTHIIDVDYPYDQYKRALRDMLDHHNVPNSQIYIRKLKKVTRIVDVETPGTRWVKRLIGLGKELIMKGIEKSRHM